MNVTYLLLILSVTSSLLMVVITIFILREAEKRGIEINYLWVRALFPRYVFQYKQLTESETGRPGVLFYPWLIFINLAWVFAIAALITHNLQ